jgi:hypothetical protein
VCLTPTLRAFVKRRYISSAVGWLCVKLLPKTWREVHQMHPLDRCLFGAVVFQTIKTCSKYLYRRQYAAMLEKRRVLNYSS